jgi:hypothetical protein
MLVFFTLLTVSAAQAQPADFDQSSLIRNVRELGTTLQRILPPVDGRRLDEATLSGNTAAADALLMRHSTVQVTINPETRVSVEALTPIGRTCGGNPPRLVRILNHGFATSTLRVVGKPPGVGVLRLSGSRLSGARVEYRLLEVSVPMGQSVEVLATFTAGASTVDLGGRGTLPLLLTCRK